jgi:TonB-dependent starch-binding outer membrane protein SusC
METKEVSVDGKSVVNVFLKDDQQKLKEVVVIGYGSVKKKDATGAIDQISSKQFDNVSSVSPAQILRGKVSGLQVTSSSGEPGSGISLRVRGASSIRSGSNALIVVDGVPLDGGDISSGGGDLGAGTSAARNPLNFINQNDIESISVLKDASSTAIYGSRGANGVIMITTKKGKSKTPELTYSSSVQFGTLSTKFKLLDTKGYIAAGGKDDGGSYNWEDAILRNSVSTNHDLSFSKSTENSNTRLSFGAANTNGIVKNTGIDKYSASLYNSNNFFGDKLKIEARIGYTNINDQTTLITNNAGFVGNLIGSALYWSPTRSVTKINGDYNVISNNILNPVELLNSYGDNSKTNKILASITTTLKIDKYLTYKFLFGIDNSSSARKRQLLPTFNLQGTPNGYASIDSRDNFNKTFEHTLNYNKEFTDNFNLDALVGISNYEYNASGNGLSAKNFDKGQINLVDNINGVVSGNTNPYSYKNKSVLNSYFGRINMTIFKDVLLTGTIRYDGSSKLGDNNKYGFFPSAGLGYKLVNDKEGIINNLKVRGSYGVTGNSEFAVNSAVDKFTYDNGNLKPQNSYNPNLRWETTTSYDAGLDFELLNTRLSGSVDYFNRDTKDLLYGVNAGGGQPGALFNRFNNAKGVINGRGVEVAINCKIVKSDSFNWEISGNASFLKSEIKDFLPFFIQETAELNGPGLTNSFVQQFENGQPVYSYRLPEFLGYDASGNSKYSETKYVDKQALPKINVGFSTTVGYKGLDLTASFYGAYGHYIYNNTNNALFFRGSLGTGKNLTPEVAASAQAAGDSNPKSTKYLEKGDFLRLGNLTLGYTFNGSFLERFKIKAARLYVNGSNLLLFTDYSGFDPEVDISKPKDGVPSAGIDYLSYPKEKTFAFGINLTF